MCGHVSSIRRPNITARTHIPTLHATLQLCAAGGDGRGVYHHCRGRQAVEGAGPAPGLCHTNPICCRMLRPVNEPVKWVKASLCRLSNAMQHWVLA